MNGRLGIVLVAFVLWTAITVIGGNKATGGKMTLVQAVQSGIGWTWVVAASFILAVVLWDFATFMLGAAGTVPRTGTCRPRPLRP